MDRRSLLLGGSATFVAGCAGSWEVDYDQTLDPLVTKSWNVSEVNVLVSEDLRVSNKNTLAPNADIVWHGEPMGNRRAQVRRILTEGITRGAADLTGPRGVIINTSLVHFHAVTPAAVTHAPAAVHNIKFAARVFDDQSGQPLSETHEIEADLEAFVGTAAVTAAVQGNTQRVRIVNHLARVTRGWLGMGPDQRRRFSGVGR